MKLLWLLLISVGCNLAVFAAETPSYEERVDQFWKFEERSRVIMRSISDWVIAHQEMDKVTPEISAEIKELIENYYSFSNDLRKFLGEQERAFINSTATHKFEELYDEDMDSELVTDSHLMEALLGALGDLLIFENLRFQFKVVSASDLFKEKLNEIEADGMTGHYSRLVENFMSRGKRLRYSNTLEFLAKHSQKLDDIHLHHLLVPLPLLLQLQHPLPRDPPPFLLQARSASWILRNS